MKSIDNSFGHTSYMNLNYVGGILHQALAKAITSYLLMLLTIECLGKPSFVFRAKNESNERMKDTIPQTAD